MVEAAQLLRLPSCFPFKITAGQTDLRRCKDFAVHRQGLDMDMVAISNNGVARPKKTKTQDKVEQLSLFDEE